MNNQNITRYARQLVRNYSNWDKLDNRYVLDVSDIPSFDLHKFAALFMQDHSLANESCGSDNNSFEKRMLPSLIRLLSVSTNRDAQVDFARDWIDGVTSYFCKDMQSAIDDALALYNVESAA